MKSVVIGLLVCGAAYVTIWVTADLQDGFVTQRFLSRELRTQEAPKLKRVSGSQRTYHQLKRLKHPIKVSVQADDQGSADISYYPMKINQRIYWVSLKQGQFPLFDQVVKIESEQDL
ncbi:hypothetical protein [Levilactobacillus bambusae]|uniref:Uncharacterized protein n=1 Tax=Levilactobacillus bambusae TaxID=2024736 RepID=A0A2V1N1W7_9LACO|nr:hypothetical protein [Levilactobacillus bambusae]PWG00335.1 hypothetical protein DCM90_05235 [Levilactobacillus bambusae]